MGTTTSGNSPTTLLEMVSVVQRSRRPSAAKTATPIPRKRKREIKKRESDHKLQSRENVLWQNVRLFNQLCSCTAVGPTGTQSTSRLSVLNLQFTRYLINLSANTNGYLRLILLNTTFI